MNQYMPERTGNYLIAMAGATWAVEMDTNKAYIKTTINNNKSSCIIAFVSI